MDYIGLGDVVPDNGQSHGKEADIKWKVGIIWRILRIRVSRKCGPSCPSNSRPQHNMTLIIIEVPTPF